MNYCGIFSKKDLEVASDAVVIDNDGISNPKQI
jgi:hypothetical protein